MQQQTFLSGPKWLNMDLYSSAEVKATKRLPATLAENPLVNKTYSICSTNLPGNQIPHSHDQHYEVPQRLSGQLSGMLERL